MKENLKLFIVLRLVAISFATFSEGDIFIGEEINVESSLDIAGGVRLADPNKLWPNGYIYYR